MNARLNTTNAKRGYSNDNLRNLGYICVLGIYDNEKKHENNKVESSIGIHNESVCNIRSF